MKIENKDYVAEYIELVEKGEVEVLVYDIALGKHVTKTIPLLVGDKIKKAIKRHLKDIEKSKDPSYPYEYRPEEAIKVVKFLELLNDPKSKQPMQLAHFQKFIVGLLYGWRKRNGNVRRFRKAYISLARKNGKSLLVAGIALYEFLFGKNPAAARQIVTAANTRQQATISYKMIKSQLMALRSVSPAIKKATTVRRFDIELNDESTVAPLASEADSLDGLDLTAIILDEYGAAKDDEMIKVLESSQSQQDEGLLLIISTATTNLNGPMKVNDYAFVEKLLNEELESDAYLALCWELDSLAEYENEDNWIKANPLFEISSAYEKMVDHKRKSLDEYRGKSDLTGWLTKENNMWVQSSQESFITKEEWESVKATKKYDIRGRKVYIGLDIARTSDMTAVSMIIPIEEEKKLLLDTHGFVSSVGGIIEKQSKDKIPYKQYENMGLVTISQRSDGLIDLDEMNDWIRDYLNVNQLDLIGIYYDPFLANSTIVNMGQEYYKKMVEVPQKINYLSSPTRALREMIRRKEVIHTDNPLLTRAMYNAIMKEFNDSIAIDKSKNRNKIDAADALINAMTDAQYHDFDAQSLQDLIDSNQFGFGY